MPHLFALYVDLVANEKLQRVWICVLLNVFHPIPHVIEAACVNARRQAGTVCCCSRVRNGKGTTKRVSRHKQACGLIDAAMHRSSMVAPPFNLHTRLPFLMRVGHIVN